MYKIEFNPTMSVFQVIRISDNKIHTIPYKTRTLAKKAVSKMIAGLARFNEFDSKSFSEGLILKQGKKASI